MKPLNIAITVDPEIPVPPVMYGGIERIVNMLVRGLVERGHEVTLFAHPDSDVPCRLQPYPALRSRGAGDVARNMWHVSSAILRDNYDVVHSFARLAYLLPILPLRIPKVMTYQRAVAPRSITAGRLLSRGTLQFTAVSRYVMRAYAGDEDWRVVYNGVLASSYQATESVDPDAPLVYLGRIEDFKGPHVAIEVALRSGRSLLLAGNVPEGTRYQKYFAEQIAPHLDGRVVRFIGPVNDREKNDLLGNAAAVLMPLLGEDSFPVVIPEALACGTPIIGFNRGPIPEAVENGVNGFVCDTVAGMVEAVKRLSSIRRRECRRIMEEKFSDRVIVTSFEQLYRELVH